MRCTFVQGVLGGYGGVLYADEADSVAITDCMFSESTAKVCMHTHLHARMREHTCRRVRILYSATVQIGGTMGFSTVSSVAVIGCSFSHSTATGSPNSVAKHLRARIHACHACAHTYMHMHGM